MKVVFNCCTKPAKFTHNKAVTHFMSEKPEVEAQAKPQAPAQDTVEISAKQPEAKPQCEGDACKK